MKLECIRDTVAFFGLNITKGKIYEATPVIYRDIYVKFVLFNDKNKWEIYDADCFIPVSASPAQFSSAE